MNNNIHSKDFFVFLIITVLAFLGIVNQINKTMNDHRDSSHPMETFLSR